MSQHTMASLIENAIEFESKARDLYLQFSEMFSHEDRICDLPPVFVPPRELVTRA